MPTIIEETVIAIRDKDNRLIAIVESDMIRRAQVLHNTSAMGFEDVKNFLEILAGQEFKKPIIIEGE